MAILCILPLSNSQQRPDAHLPERDAVPGSVGRLVSITAGSSSHSLKSVTASEPSMSPKAIEKAPEVVYGKGALSSLQAERR